MKAQGAREGDGRAPELRRTELKEQLFRLRFQKSTGQISNPFIFDYETIVDSVGSTVY